MARHKNHDWTLLYVKQRGASLALAQVYLNPSTSAEHLLGQVYPEIRAAMKKRAAPWRLLLQEEGDWLGELELWEHPEGRQRHLEALWAWWSLHGQAQCLGQVHPNSLEDGCACLLGGPVSLDAQALDVEALACALKAWRTGQAVAQMLPGVSRRGL
jgi:hypothetical protein